MTNKTIPKNKTDINPVIKQQNYNKGEIAEAVLASAITARFLKGKEEIDILDVYAIVDKLEISNETDIDKPELLTGQFDRIILNVNIPNRSIIAFRDKTLRPEFEDIYQQSVNFSNSEYVSQYSNLIDKNSKEDTAVISSEGTLHQKLTKIDLSVKIGYDKGKPVRTKLNISLKYDKTTTIESSGVLFKSQVALWDKFDIDIKEFAKYHVSNKPDEQWYRDLFSYLSIYINKSLLGENEKYDFIKGCVKGIRETALRNEDDVSLMRLTKNSFIVYDFEGLEDKLRAIELEAYTLSESNRPTLIIRDKISKQKLLAFRIKFLHGRLDKMFVEKESLLDTLLTNNNPITIKEYSYLTFEQFLKNNC